MPDPPPAARVGIPDHIPVAVANAVHPTSTQPMATILPTVRVAAASIATSGVEDDDTRAFRMSHLPEERDSIAERFLPRFSQIAFLINNNSSPVAIKIINDKNGVVIENYTYIVMPIKN